LNACKQFTKNNETYFGILGVPKRTPWVVYKKRKQFGELSAGGHSNFLRDISINKRTKEQTNHNKSLSKMGRQGNMTNYELKSQGTINQQIICEGFFSVSN